MVFPSTSAVLISKCKNANMVSLVSIIYAYHNVANVSLLLKAQRCLRTVSQWQWLGYRSERIRLCWEMEADALHTSATLSSFGLLAGYPHWTTNLLVFIYTTIHLYTNFFKLYYNFRLPSTKKTPHRLWVQATYYNLCGHFRDRRPLVCRYVHA